MAIGIRNLTGISATRALGRRKTYVAYPVYSFLMQKLLSIPDSAVLLQTRGFRPTSQEKSNELENVGRSFLVGYHEALKEPNIQILSGKLAALDDNERGFAFEGAAMAAWLLDSLSISHHRRWSELLSFASNSHPYVVHVGAGWALARLPWTKRAPERVISRLDPLLRWLVIDGYGFHQGYFYAATWVRQPSNRPNLSGYARRAFDQGLGRSLWFVEGANVDQIANTIYTFAPGRRADLWSGVGLACAYAGRASTSELEQLVARAGTYVGHLRQGTAFGTEARMRGRIANSFTERTCKAICRQDTRSVAELTSTAKSDVNGSTDSHERPRYELWRTRIRDVLCQEVPSCI